MTTERIGLQVRTTTGPGVLHRLTGVIAHLRGDISSVAIASQSAAEDRVYLEIDLPGPAEDLVAALEQLDVVRGVELVDTLKTIYGKRIIIMGGGAQVGQVALGAITEADRHNIRGERISVDTIPLVGEKVLAAAVRAVVRLPRVRLLVLAGALMGGEITEAVEAVRRQGLIVISLNMAGSVPDAADLVVSDPVQAGVMAVMAIADTAKFDILRQQKRRY
jgi:energy-converting hydrogenase B subunit Q